jgi:IMP dehydrogenase/GMP reductase
LSCYKEFIRNDINVILPRTISLEERVEYLCKEYLNRGVFFALSLTEAQILFLNDILVCTPEQSLIVKIRKALISNETFVCHICIDIANGHMSELLDTIKAIKEKYREQVVIMSGNIANPKTYEEYEKVGCDFVRCNIGSGSRCTTSSNTGIHFGCFSLIKEIYDIKQKINGKCRIIADGGIKGYGDIQKALLYADYVMIGSLFNKAIDSAGTSTYGKSYWNIFGERVLNPFKTLLTYGKSIKPKDYEKVLKQVKEGKLDVWKEYYGMSTKIAQKKMNGGGKLKTGEGKSQRQKVEYTIKQWIENEQDFLRSAMSYTNSKTLTEYKESQWIQLTYRAYNI